MKKNKVLYLVVHIIGFLIAARLIHVANQAYHNYPNTVFALFLPVNHSLWEHAKLYFIPTTIVAIAEFLIIGKQYKNYLAAHNITTFFMPLVMILAYSIMYFVFPKLADYKATYAVMGVLVLFLGWIATFIICNSRKRLFLYTGKSLLLLLILQCLFIIFTFFPPEWKYMFFCSIYETYGIPLP